MATNKPVDMLELVSKIQETQAKIKKLGDNLKVMTDFLSDHFSGEAANLFEAAEKDSGDITFSPFSAQPDLKLVASISKDVKWDSKALLEAGKDLPWKDFTELFKIEVSVPERVFGSLGVLRKDLYPKVAAARVVKYGQLKVQLKKEDVK